MQHSEHLNQKTIQSAALLAIIALIASLFITAAGSATATVSRC